MSVARSRRSVALLAVGTVVALTLAACGSSSGGSQNATSTSGATASSAPDLGSATIVLGGAVITWAPAYVAACEGFWKKHGLDVNVTVSQHGTTAAISAMLSGDAISAMTGAPAAVAPIAQGAPVQLLFNASQGYGVQVAASNAWLRKKGITSSSSLADRIKALKGAKVGILNPGDSISQLYGYVLPKYGLSTKDITEIAFGGYPPQLAALKNGSIDVMAGSPPWGSEAEAQGLGKILFEGNEVPGLDNYPYLVGDVATKDIQKNPARVKALIQGMADAMTFLHKTPDAGKACVKKQFPDLDQATFDSAYKFAMSTVPKSPEITPAIFKALQDFSQASGQPIGVSYSQAVADSIVKQALGTG